VDIAAILRRDAPAPPEGLDVPAVEQAIAHGIAPLVYAALHDRGVWERAAPDARDRLARVAREAILLEPVRAEHLTRVVAAMGAEGVRPLLFKGAAVAVTHYPSPWLRPRGDSDFLVRPDESARARAVLERMGFARVPRPQSLLVTQQSRYSGAFGGVPLAYDVHWRVADPHAFAHAFLYDELERRAIEHPSGARRVSDVDALAIACVHRAAHHYDAPHLLLLYDIHLIAKAFGPAEWDEIAALARERRLKTVIRRGLELASDAFGLAIPLTAQDALAGGSREGTGLFVGRRLRRVDILVSDLRALPSWSERVQLLQAHLFPERSYLAASAADGSARVSYLRRAASGARHWFRPL
jgi:hypothetical protein